MINQLKNGYKIIKMQQANFKPIEANMHSLNNNDMQIFNSSVRTA
jgi:hypothetical protein